LFVPSSSFGAGQRNYNDNYWFNAQSMWIACDNGAYDPSITCDFVVTGYTWNATTKAEQLKLTHHFDPVPPCPGFENCELTFVTFPPEFTGLSTLSMYANVQGKPSIFWIDTVALSWWNNTCEAGLARISSR